MLHVALRAAKSRAWVTTPYFVPDSATQRLLHEPPYAERTSGCWCRARATYRSRNGPRVAYSRLLACGVRVYEYKSRVLHAKTLLVDTEWAMIGTANLDYRSLFVNDELNLIDESGELNLVLAQIFEDDLRESEEVLAMPWSQRTLARRVAEAIGWWGRRWL